MNNKREVVEVVETVWTTTTVWIDPTKAPYAGFYEAFPTGAFKGAKHSSSSSSSSSSYVPAVTAAPVAPAVSSPPAAPSVPAAAPYVAPAPAAPSVPAAVPASTGSGTGSYTGDITYYNIENGAQGSCGLPIATNNDAVVALSLDMMQNGGNSNKNTKCGQTILLTYQGKTTPAKVYDSCAGCKFGDVDLSPGLFKVVAPNGDGRVSGVSWSFA
jgi:hypothetical protein